VYFSDIMVPEKRLAPVSLYAEKRIKGDT